VLAFRYVKGTKATLGFTCFDPTCIIELDGVLSRESYDFYAKVWKMLEENDIPFTFHWGKILELNPERLRKIYGEKVEEWIIARNSLMKDAASMRVFTNKLLTDWGLSRIGADTNPVSPAV
jgi:peptidoglycan/xylan/chitin deacetylase (PgdA/CDA1 family)